MSICFFVLAVLAWTAIDHFGMDADDVMAIAVDRYA